MPKKTVAAIKAPSAEAIYAASTLVSYMPGWRRSLKPLMDGAASHLKNTGTIVPDLPAALEEFGRYCRLLGREIGAAQAERAQAAIAPVPSSAATEPAPEPARQNKSRRAGETSSSAPRPVGRPRKPARRE